MGPTPKPPLVTSTRSASPRAGSRHRGDALERGADGDARRVEAPRREAMAERVAEGAGPGDAERVEALLGPHGVRPVVGHDADERARELPLAARPAEDDERQVMRRDDRARRERDDALHEPRPRHVIDARVSRARAPRRGGWPVKYAAP